MLTQLKVLGLVFLMELLEITVYLLARSVGFNNYHALNVVAGFAIFLGILGGIDTTRRLEYKALSKTGAPRISLAAYLSLWCGLGTLITVLMSSSLSWQLAQGGYVLLILCALMVFCLAVFAARSLNAEVAYSTRQYAPTLLFLVFFLVAIVLPPTVSLIPIWGVFIPIGFQGLIVIVLMMSQTPVAQGTRRQT
jgi:hypothetical protein